MDYSGKIIKKTPVVPTQQSASGVWSLDEALQATKSNTWPVANVPNPISRSLRFRSSASAFLNRTPAAATNRKTWTWSAWVKRGILGVRQGLFSCQNGAGNASLQFGFLDNDCFQMGNGNVYLLQSSALYRDPSAWYHVVVNIDTTLASNRSKVYINGTQITAWATNVFDSNVSQNTDMAINNNLVHYLGQIGASLSYFDGYIGEVNFIDGQALTPSSFGGTNAVTGVWEPRQYTGTYGTNGFYLNFKDNTSTSTLGLDYSGNSNNWTTNNISLTAGSTYDSMLDVPTQWIGYNTGDVASVTRGNYCVWNPINNNNTNTITNGNLSGSNNGGTYATMSLLNNKYYWEYFWTSGTATAMGVSPTNRNIYFSNVGSGAVSYFNDGQKSIDGTNSAYGASYTTSDVIGVALDTNAGTVTFYKNNASQGAITLPSGITEWVASVWSRSGTVGFNANFGQRPFTYTPPAGFRSLCTTNLPSSTILQGNQYFDATLWSGNDTSQTITNSGGFQPDFVWIKQRSSTNFHQLNDVVRGNTKYLYSNNTEAEETVTTRITSYNSNGFSLGSSVAVNSLGSSYVGWQWDAGGTGVINTAGSITSTVSANTSAGFSVVTYTGNGVNGATVGHGLGVKPAMFIVKLRSGADNWTVYHQSMGATKGIQLNQTSALQTLSGYWNDTEPTSSVFSLGTYSIANGATFVAYCFSEIAGYSKFGSYTGNGSTDGVFVYLGFRPKFVMIKRTDSGNNWFILDTARDTFNLANDQLLPNSSAAESTGSDCNIDILSNGFKLRTALDASNGSGGTYIYMTFAENPFKNALAR